MRASNSWYRKLLSWHGEVVRYCYCEAKVRSSSVSIVYVVRLRILIFSKAAIKWLSEKHRSSDKCIYFQTVTPLFLPSLKLLLERLMHRYDAPRSLQFAICFHSGGCFEHSGAQLNMSQSDSINNRTVNLSFLTVLSSNKLKSPQY